MHSDVDVFPAPHLRIRQDELNRMCSFREPQCVSCVCFHPHVPNKIETLCKTKTECNHLQMICVYRRRLYNPAFHKLTYERLMQPFVPNHHWFDSDFKLPWVKYTDLRRILHLDVFSHVNGILIVSTVRFHLCDHWGTISGSSRVWHYQRLAVRLGSLSD